MTSGDGLWATLSPQVRRQVDELLCARRNIEALRVLWQDSGLEPRPGLHAVQQVADERYSELDRQGLVAPPPPPPTTAQLVERAAAGTAPVVVVEAYWDGDTQGWYIRLVAIVRRPGQDHERFDEVPLTVVSDGGDLRLFNGQAPPWSETRRATELGRTVAERLGVPFHFTSPDTPDIDLPRWWDART